MNNLISKITLVRVMGGWRVQVHELRHDSEPSLVREFPIADGEAELSYLLMLCEGGNKS